MAARTMINRRQLDTDDSVLSRGAIDLYWLPLGAGGHFVRLNGILYEALSARLGRRPVYDLYHSALEVQVPEGRFVIESAPIRASDGPERGVVGEGSVGSRRAGWLPIFRYELRCWRDGVIPDVAEAVESPRRLSDDRSGRFGCSRSPHLRRRPFGDATSFMQAKCGTRIPLSRG
jgi:hypothetical protein